MARSLTPRQYTRAHISSLQRNLAQYREWFGEDDPRCVRLREMIAESRANLEKERDK